MVAIPFGVNAYRRNAGQFGETRLVNQYLEISPDKSVKLIGRPGLTSYRSYGTFPIMGMYSQPGSLNGDLFVVTGNTLYRKELSVGAVMAYRRVSMASSETELLVATGTTMYRYTDSGLTTVVFPDDAGENSVIFFAGLFVVARTGTQKFYWSAVLDGSTWNALSFASAERKPDNLVGLAIVGDELWMAGENSFEFWTSTGDADAPFQRIEGRVFDKGCLNRDTLANFDNTLAWVGNDRIVYRGGPVPQRISDYGIEERLARTSADEVSAWAFNWNGHYFYVVHTAEGDFAYDAATQQWSEFKSYNRTGWQARTGCILDGILYAGDDRTGTVWNLSQNALLDGDQPVERISSAIIKSTMPAPLNSVHVDIAPGQTPYLTGQGADPVVELRLSRDGGKTYSDWRSAPIGGQGDYRRRSVWRRCGLMDEPGVVMEFRTTDPAPWALSGVRANELAGGRSR